MREVPEPRWNPPLPGPVREWLERFIPPVSTSGSGSSAGIVMCVSRTLTSVETHWVEGRSVWCPGEANCPVDHKFQLPRWCGYLHVWTTLGQEAYVKVTDHAARKCPLLIDATYNLRFEKLECWRKDKRPNSPVFFKAHGKIPNPREVDERDLRRFISQLITADDRPASYKASQPRRKYVQG